MSVMKKDKVRIQKSKLHKIRKPRAIHKPEQTHKDRRREYYDNDSNWKSEMNEELDEYYSTRED
tara:strand:- start:870 stop:1061 length:192 start_codon:yes stop_codon:yes gene_type:complete